MTPKVPFLNSLWIKSYWATKFAKNNDFLKNLVFWLLQGDGPNGLSSRNFDSDDVMTELHLCSLGPRFPALLYVSEAYFDQFNLSTDRSAAADGKKSRKKRGKREEFMLWSFSGNWWGFGLLLKLHRWSDVINLPYLAYSEWKTVALSILMLPTSISLQDSNPPIVFMHNRGYICIIW